MNPTTGCTRGIQNVAGTLSRNVRGITGHEPTVRWPAMASDDPRADDLHALVHELRNQLTPARLRLDAARLLSTDSALTTLLSSLHASLEAITRLANAFQALDGGAAEPGTSPLHEPSSARHTAAHSGARPITLLLVDDHPVLADALLAWFAADDMFAPAQHARTAAETWAILASGAQERPSRLPDVVLLDLQLPDASGLDLCRALRDAYPSLRILLHSGALHSLHAFEAHAAGASGVLPKGLEPAALRRAIREALDAAPQGATTAATSTANLRTRTGQSSPAPSA